MRFNAKPPPAYGPKYFEQRQSRIVQCEMCKSVMHEDAAVLHRCKNTDPPRKFTPIVI